MTLKLALKNLKAKPWRTVASVLVIAVAVAMFFAMFALEGAVYEYVYAVETADFGDYDIMISAKSGGDRLALVEPLEEVAGVSSFVPTVSVYALLENGDDGEYIRLRGFSRGDIEKMNSVKVASGNAEELFTNSDNVIISEAMSRALGIGVGDRLSVASLASSGGSRGFFVVAVAQNEGYFVADSPYTVLGSASGVAQLISPGGVEVFNEIYVDVADGADAESVRDAVAALPEYAELTVSLTVDEAYISTRAGNLSAPVTIAGAAVALLSLVSVALIFTLGVADRRAYAAKLALVGATKRKIAALFFTESAVIAAIGAIVGSVLAVGVFALLIQIVLSSVVSFSVNALLLFGAAVTGGVAAVAASVYPLFRVFRASARENLFSVEKKSLAPVVFSACLGAAVLALLLVENFVSGAMGVLSAVNMVLVIAFAATLMPFAVRGLGRLMSRSPQASVMVAGFAAQREKRASRSSQVLAVGLTVSMLLFMTWSLTTTIFADFTAEFRDMIIVTNVSSAVDEDEFAAVEGVDGAYLMVWGQGSLNSERTGEVTTNILGSSSALGLADFEYITPREDVLAALGEGKAVLDYSLHELYNLNAGDTVSLVFDGERRDFVVGGFVRHKLFNGAYTVVSSEAMDAAYGVSPDTVVLTVRGDVAETAERVRSVFADRNYYAIPALEAYEWDTASLENIFDLVAALAFVLSALVLAVLFAGTVIGRAHSERTRGSLLAAGLSKNALLGAEIAEHAVSAIPALAVALPVSALATLCLIHALRMFGLYFEFVFNAGVAFAAGAVLAALYIAIPLVAGFRRHYSMRRE